MSGCRVAIACLLLTVSCPAQVPQTSNTTENLRGLSVPSDSIAWASGSHGAYLRTVDGGKSWTAAQVPGADALDFRDIEAFGKHVAYVLAAGPGEQSRIYKTTDAGRHWVPQFTNHDPRGFLDCMAFWDNNHGIVLGDPVDGKFVLLTTDDGGRHWKQLRNSPSAIEGEGAFAASGTCIATTEKEHVWFASGGTAARVFHSGERGRTWSVVESPLPHSNVSSGIFSIAFSDRTHGVIAGGDYKAPGQGTNNLAFTRDGGKSWQLSPVSPQRYFSAVTLLVRPGQPDAMLAVGTALAALSDDVRARVWRATWHANLNAVAFGRDGTALAVGTKGLIVKFPLSP
jgi:photosystem II stability/assembly factor-like uncharacterized protein